VTGHKALTRDFAAENAVEVAGIEPASSDSSTGLLRAHPVGGSRAPLRHRHRCGTPVSWGVPVRPADGADRV